MIELVLYIQPAFRLLHTPNAGWNIFCHALQMFLQDFDTKIYYKNLSYRYNKNQFLTFSKKFNIQLFSFNLLPFKIQTLNLICFSRISFNSQIEKNGSPSFCNAGAIYQLKYVKFCDTDFKKFTFLKKTALVY